MPERPDTVPAEWWDEFEAGGGGQAPAGGPHAAPGAKPAFPIGSAMAGFDSGAIIPTNDIWIAATAMEHGLRLLTTDSHYERVRQVVVSRFES